MPPSPWYAVVLTLQACADGVVPRTHGHQVHGLFHDLIQRIDPALSAAIHEGSTRRPYTLSPLLGLPEADQNGHVVPAGASLHLRLTILDARLFGGAIAALLGENPARDVRLGRMRFAVRRVATAPDQHPWAGIITPQ